MKQGRQSMILELIENHDVETQEELLALLREKGYEVIQATISRDIKEPSWPRCSRERHV